MRMLAIVGVLAINACSDAPPTKAEEAAVDKIDAGQWQTDVEVTRLTAMDKGTPRIDTPAGTRTSASTCVGEAERQRPAPPLLTAAKDSCTYKDFYMSGGTINATMSCARPGLNGDVLMVLQGTYKAGSFEGALSTDTYLLTDGDVRIAAKVSGRRTGACAG